jgi:thymidylate synthase (FAD)
MTEQQEVAYDPKYQTVLDHGFVGLVDYMGDDSAIVQAARVSYGKGTKQVNQDRGLIRYLMRHRHTSPFEMVQTKWHIKLPIFVMRQLVRHRTAAINEYSARYSVLSDEFYVPALEDVKPQSTNNKQGRGGDISEEDAEQVRQVIDMHNDSVYQLYQMLLGADSTMDFDGKGDLRLSDDFDGIARELARMVLPVNGYTECYWSINLHNLFHFIKLRADPHAQKEIRVFAEAMYQKCLEHWPMATEAFDDYVMGGAHFSRTEMDILRKVFKNEVIDDDMLEDFGLSKREIDEFRTKLA